MKKGIDHIGVCVIFFCHDGKGNFLLGKRSKLCRDEHGRWDPGGGGINFKEPVLKALKREIREEYCTTILRAEFLGFRDVHRKDENGRKTHWISLDFSVLVDRKTVKSGEPRKQEEIGWFRLNKLPKPLHSQLSFFLKKYRTQLSGVLVAGS